MSTNTLLPYLDQETGITNVLAIFCEGWNLHDVKIFSLAFAEDADFTNVLGVSRSGRTAIEDLHAPLFRTIWASSVLTIYKHKIRFIKPDIAAVDAWWTLEGLRTPEGADLPSREGLLNFLMTQIENQWMITVMHNMDLPGSRMQKC